MEQERVVHETSVQLSGKRYLVQVFSRGNGRFFALTRFRDKDAVITDGASLREALDRHLFSLPFAVSCRTGNAAESGASEGA